MRPQKNRSRSKSNRNNNNNNRSNVNIVNRVFDSSGPEGKVRGTPQQIIEKYTQLARDAQLSHDRVALENFQQHAEHYTRMLSEAQREQEARREAQEAQHRERQIQQNEQRQQHQNQGNDNQSSDENEQPQPQHHTPRNRRAAAKPVVQEGAEQPDIFEGSDQPDTGLVETPESKPVKKVAKPRAPRKKPVEDQGGASVPDTPNEAAE